ncbi:MAG: sarcosine oxidase subunit gamma family protein [Pseudomonadota bacterium]
MVEPRSPIAGILEPGVFGAAGTSGVALGNRRLNGLCQIAGWDGFAAAADPALRGLGLDGLGDFRNARSVEAVTAWRIAPDKLWLEGAGDLGAHASEALMVLDLGHTRTVLTLAGPDARDLLSALISVDTRASALPPGEFVQCGLHHVGVLIHCTGPQTFDILVPGSWAESLWDLILQAALPFGVTVTEAE